MRFQVRCVKSENQKMNFAIFIVLFFYCFLLVSANLNDAKKNGLKTLSGYVDHIKKLADETSAEVQKREENIKIITKHEREFGDGIFGQVKFEISKTAKSAYMMANLLGGSNDLFRCIEYREREGLTENDRYYHQKFLTPGRDYEMKAEEYQRDLIKHWKDDYYKAIDQYGKIYQKAVSDVQKATKETAITTLVKQFEQTSKQMADIIIGVLPNLNQTHIQVLKIFDQLIGNLQKYAKYQVEATGQAIHKCFPKFFQYEAFFGQDIF